MNDSPRAWEGVLHHLEAHLLSGELSTGDHLPPERALAAELSVGRSSVREAVRVLEALGLVRTQTGSGPQAGATIIGAPSGGMSSLMRLQVAAKGFAVADVVKTRIVLECSIVTELADAGTDVDFVHATQLLDAMDSDSLTPKEFLALDARFHLSLADASGNLVVSAMMAGIRNSIESYVILGIPTIADWRTEAQRLRTEHRGILTAIKDHNAAAASAKVHSHISDYYARTRLTDQAETTRQDTQ